MTNAPDVQAKEVLDGSKRENVVGVEGGDLSCVCRSVAQVDEFRWDFMSCVLEAINPPKFGETVGVTELSVTIAASRSLSEGIKPALGSEDRRKTDINTGLNKRS
jgi:hypothetical protein